MYVVGERNAPVSTVYACPEGRGSNKSFDELSWRVILDLFQ